MNIFRSQQQSQTRAQDENNNIKQKDVKKSQIPVRRPALSNVTNTTTGVSSKLYHPVSSASTANTHTSTTTTLVSSDAVIKDSGIKRPASQEDVLQHKRTKTMEYEYEDLDADDWNDPNMVSEYVVEIFEYLAKLEIKTLPLATYMEKQIHLTDYMRDELCDWLNAVHLKFRLLPETFFIAINIIDRFLSREVVLPQALQLVGTAALFIASKYEEIYSPSVNHFAHESGCVVEDILNAEKYILEVLEFDLSYPNPMNFIRRISKADDYDVNTRNIAKYFIEISVMDVEFIGVRPSLSAAAAMYLSRRLFGKDEWNGNLIYYSGGITESELMPVAHQYLKYLVQPVQHESFFRKYSSKKYLKASIVTRQWAKQLMKEGELDDI
ncbi:CLB2 [Cyberlindnera jadinii]|uniref:A/B/D/E cyclin n=1 Tax=Cyberlindnera jadinii (strain ATCC 18201 / CBS 1600 / BCRC 20928 / JCM 3617 / NBRC 0987 / NRRL Y-1542) TaxID=983966 RepID=A0A0H5CE66_CYBJN|nr:A/B/D/E cyclin [Cyberlindnera jadinii NRRL Y-1542]ODV71667.1 A/B/D/E cyclin [Cyberlindnera jadinii NRRL Y-1542]CEP22879.1 CLB2 [Cyberlindnera jadinii]